MKSKTISFEPVEGLNRVTVAIADESVVVDAESPYETSDPAMIAALDALPSVQRAVAKPSKGSEGADTDTPDGKDS